MTLTAWPLGAPILRLFTWLAARPLGALFDSPFWACLTPHPAGADGRLVRFARPLCPWGTATVVIACICPLWWLSMAAWPLEESAGGGVLIWARCLTRFLPSLHFSLWPLPLSAAPCLGKMRVSSARWRVLWLSWGGGGEGVQLFVLPFCLIATSVHIPLGLGFGCGPCGERTRYGGDLFGPASLRIQLGLAAGWCDLPAFFVRGRRRPS